MGYAFKFAYDGSKFTGYQKGNGKRSVEDTIIESLMDAGINAKVMSAARTDRGVSAMGNVAYIDSNERADKISGIVNSGSEDILFHSYALVKGDFRPRHCDMKIYRYIIPLETIVKTGFTEILSRFVGTHDFSHFSRVDGRNPVRTVDRIETVRSGNVAFLDFYAQSFLWNQIRSMIAFAEHFGPVDTTIDPFSINTRFPEMADPRHLVLMDIFYSNLNFKKLQLRRYEKDARRDKLIAETRLELAKFLLNVIEGSEEKFSYPFNRMRNDHP